MRWVYWMRSSLTKERHWETRTDAHSCHRHQMDNTGDPGYLLYIFLTIDFSSFQSGGLILSKELTTLQDPTLPWHSCSCSCYASYSIHAKHFVNTPDISECALQHYYWVQVYNCAVLRAMFPRLCFSPSRPSASSCASIPGLPQENLPNVCWGTVL